MQMCKQVNLPMKNFKKFKKIFIKNKQEFYKFIVCCFHFFSNSSRRMVKQLRAIISLLSGCMNWTAGKKVNNKICTLTSCLSTIYTLCLVSCLYPTIFNHKHEGKKGGKVVCECEVIISYGQLFLAHKIKDFRVS